MTEYGKRKCELLEQKGFKANDIVYWVAHENEDVRLYYYVKKRMGAERRFRTVRGVFPD